MAMVSVTHFTDPGCPFAYSSEPQLWRLKWRYGPQLDWTTRMVGLADSREDYSDKGFTPELILGSYKTFAEDPGMPFDLSLRSAVAATLPACREVVAAREHGGQAVAEALLRQLRLQGMAHGLLIDELHTLREASHAAGIDSADLDAWAADPSTEEALKADLKAARHPAEAAIQLSNKLARWDGGWRYTCPSLVLESGERTAVAPGFLPALAYDVAFANVAPGLERADAATDPLEVLAWAGTPLATLEIATVMEISRDEARAKLIEAGATEQPLGTDALWTA
ncbi:MAG: DsbA family protein [Solirubrobacteraceae bacterium]|nr:DsbA family protein [Solirubrobacteraceae bacterium]